MRARFGIKGAGLQVMGRGRRPIRKNADAIGAARAKHERQVSMAQVLTYEEVVELSQRFRRWLPASYNMHAPQHLLSVYLFHKEGHLCQACRYNYAGHAEGMALANQTWARFDVTHSESEAL